MMGLFPRFGDRIGVTIEADQTALRFPEQHRAICEPSALHDHRAAGWKVVPVPATFPDLVAAIAAGSGHEAHPFLMSVAVTELVTGFGVSQQPQRSTSGKLLRWDDADVVVIVAGKAPSGLPDSTKVFSVVGNVGRAFHQIRVAALTILAAGGRHDATNPSSQEARLAKALLAAGLPTPVRDLRLCRRGGRGSLYSQPDFAWPDVKLLLDVDGWYFHAAQALDVLLAGCDAESARKALVAADRTRVEKDAVKRRLAAVDGWTVMTCTDIEIDRSGTERIATDVASVYRRLRATAADA